MSNCKHHHFETIDNKGNDCDHSHCHFYGSTKEYSAKKCDKIKRQTQHLFPKFIAALVIPSLALFFLSEFQTHRKSQLIKSLSVNIQTSQTALCSHTCTFSIVESIPENISFGAIRLPESTFSAWNSLIRNSKSDLLIAAYKSSLRGKHVLGIESNQLFSTQGEHIFDALLESGIDKGVTIRIVENYPPKDKGDNEDAASLERRGAVHRRHLNLGKILGKGTMHSKFIISDQRNFYLGSANLDWRSLNQKMELGVFVKNCPCLANDLSNVFNSYWSLTSNGQAIGFDEQSHRLVLKEAIYNMQKPLSIFHKGVPTDVYIATSPPILNGPHRTWDLDAILHAIDSATSYLYIHVMDYFPMFIYTKPPRYWPIIDDAIRRAIFRGVEVKMLAAALHYPAIGLRFLSSLEMLNGINVNGSIEVRIFKVPTSSEMQKVMVRERRTHNKFLVTDDTVIIGTSNWSGDYFDGGSTGAAFVVSQRGNDRLAKPLVDEMRNIFLRDWYSEYTHSVSDYIEECLFTRTATFCEVDKDPSLLATTPPTTASNSSSSTM